MALVLSMMQPYTAIDRSAAYSEAFGVLVGDEPDGEEEGVVASLEEAAVAPMPMCAAIECCLLRPNRGCHCAAHRHRICLEYGSVPRVSIEFVSNTAAFLEGKSSTKRLL
jgi:hypothetical protein